MSDQTVIFTDDYTRIANYDSRQFTLGDDFSLAGIGGVSWSAAWFAILRAGTWWAPRFVTPAVIALWIVELPAWLPVLSLPVYMIVAYSKASRDTPDVLTAAQELALRRLDNRQPTAILGLTEDLDVETVEWHTILRVPSEEPK